jgi:hypothetical protein
VKLGKQKETIRYLLTRFPFAKAGLELVMSGCDSAITQFEELAPMTDAE